MDKSTWKRAEARVARTFGAKRNSLSGGNSKVSRSDSTSAEVFLEVKWSKKASAVRTLMDRTRELAAKEGKVAVVALGRLNYPGWVCCVHCEDLPRLVLALVDKNEGIRQAVLRHLSG